MEASPQSPASTWRRILVWGTIGLTVGQAVFGLISGSLDGFGEIADRVGHLVGLPALAIIFTVAVWRSLPLRGRGLIPVAAIAAVTGTAAYILAFIMIGPPYDTVFNIVVMAIVLAVGQMLSFRHRIPTGLIAGSTVAGYASGNGPGTGDRGPICRLPEPGSAWWSAAFRDHPGKHRPDRGSHRQRGTGLGVGS